MAKRLKKPSGGPRYEKLDHDYIRKLGTVSLPSLDYSWRRDETRDIPSLGIEGTSGALVNNSVMDPVNLAREAPEVRDAIIAKSKRLAPAYNKGAVQYVSDDTDPKTIGRK